MHVLFPCYLHQLFCKVSSLSCICNFQLEMETGIKCQKYIWDGNTKDF